MVIRTLTVLLILLPMTALGQDPVHVHEGDPAPFSGVLTTTTDAARLTADLLAYRQSLTACEEGFVECQDEADLALKLQAQSFRAELQECRDQLFDHEPTVTNEIPWWGWVTLGVLVTGAFGGGLWVGSAL